MILGSQNPKFTNINGTDTVDLQHCIVEADYMQSNEIEHQSVMDGKRAYTKVSNPHAEFIITIHLFKYANQVAFWNKLLSYLNQDVIFYPHKDKTLNFKAHITDMKLLYLEQPYHYDTVQLVIKSVDPISYTITE